jgi:hypothetical protein
MLTYFSSARQINFHYKSDMVSTGPVNLFQFVPKPGLRQAPDPPDEIACRRAVNELVFRYGVILATPSGKSPKRRSLCYGGNPQYGRLFYFR